MPDLAGFRFEPDMSGRINGRSFYWRLPTDICARGELFRTFAAALWFPRGFGENWDDLLDCMCDFGWMPDCKIVLAHETLPRLPDDDLKRYLALLRDVLRWWRGDEAHAVEVVFPESARAEIVRLMSER